MKRAGPSSIGTAAHSGPAPWWADVLSLAEKTFWKWAEDPTSRFAAALAFYSSLAIVPLVVLIMMVAAQIMGEAAAKGDLYHQIQQLAGEAVAQRLLQLIEQWLTAGSPWLNEMIAFGIFVMGTVRVMDQLRDALDCLWGLKPKRSGDWFRRLQQRFASSSSLLGIGFILVVSLMASIGLNMAARPFLLLAPENSWVHKGLEQVVSFVVITTVFALIYKWVPQAEVTWRSVWIGAAFTGLLYEVGNLLIVRTLGHSALVGLYGGAGSLVLILLWAYYTSHIMLFGAAFIAVHAENRGSPVKPNAEAEEVRSPSTGEGEGASRSSP